MKSVHIADLKNNLSRHLNHVRRGEEILIRDRNTPIARIVPLAADDLDEWERHLVATGQMTLPKKPLDVKAFLAEPAPRSPGGSAVEALLKDRDESEDRLLGR
ncbi:MAG: type II toxin-antitoxin system prevent-host-death family antitoxin [Candidatus Solibacter usitatus]|nr:type II toxin-antitoxin system prevent-host-death family antitoxin [Candidatus Solibacter usitatus]